MSEPKVIDVDEFFAGVDDLRRYLERHLQQVVEQIQSSSPVLLAAIGIGHDVSAFYRNATKIGRVDDLGPALTDKLIALLGDADDSNR